MPVLQWMQATPLFSLVRFGHWEEVLKQPQPKGDAPFVTAMWHYARGLARLRPRALQSPGGAGPAAKARQQQASRALWEPDFPGLSVSRLAITILQAEVEGSQGHPEKRRGPLEKAVQPPGRLAVHGAALLVFSGTPAPVAALLEAGHPERAEQVYRADCKRDPRNGWSLFGLLQCLRAQGRAEEAREVERQFQEAWRHADVTLTASCF